MDHVSKLEGTEKPSLDRTASSDHKEDDIPFKVVHRTHQVTGSSTLTPVLALAPVGPASVPSIETREDVVQF